ncbi:methylated-DNA--[protein]-cysteine S-methyltransferase [Utexia brackfieldae]|uniref:bifunctional transcriptional activator/DNA repair enzyme AdaA n=1 Tax=Utexia brackfieldae TaxID=3074108 RepID=UPI00370D75B1
MELNNQIMYQAFLAKDSQFEGLFFAGIKTTGIFCRPTCHARKPKPENIEYFPTYQAAIEQGYRPCKLCKPHYLPDQTPDDIIQLLEVLDKHPDQKIKDSDLQIMGLEPSTIRRWFIKHHGMTFHTYQRTIRVNSAFNKIQAGESILNSAYENGFESLSGFSTSFKTIFGTSPSQVKTDQRILLHRIETPIGAMFTAATEKGICLLEFLDQKQLESELKTISLQFKAVIVPGENSHIMQLKQELAEYFQGHRIHFDVALDTAGTPFQQLVWQTLQQIPYGETCSYQQEANQMDKPTAVRAVANANGKNRISIVIPCHRVIGTDGTLTGYAGGVWRKRWLLALEQQYKP